MSSTPYDDVFRTLLTDCTELMIPVVNEIFHTDYTGNEKYVCSRTSILYRCPTAVNRSESQIPALKL